MVSQSKDSPSSSKHPNLKPKIKTIDELRKWLQPTEYLSPGNEYMKHLHSYVPGTGDWLRDSPCFRRWEDGIDRGCLWVRGIPGTGKSVFAASTVKTLAETQDGEGKSAPVLFFFFRQIVEKNHDPKYLVRDWVAQLLPSSRDLRGKIHELSNHCNVDGIERTKLWDALVDSLDGMKKVYCVADALDEMDDQHANFIERLRDLGLRRPENIKVLLTSRPIPRIENLLRQTEVESVRLDPKQIYPDTVCYIASRLNSLVPRLSIKTEEKVTEAICVRAEGLFLYARLIMDSLTEGLREGSILEENLPTALEELPMNLKELYTRMLAEHSRRSGITQEQQLTILQCVVYASRPLRLIELGSIIALLRKDAGAGLKEGKDLVRQACGRLLEILEDESVSVIHHSFTEFARDQSRNGEPGAFPVLNEGESQRMMLQVCFQYLDSFELPGLNAVPHKTGESEEQEKERAYLADLSNLDDYDDCHDDRHVRDSEEEALKSKLQGLRNRYPLMDYATLNLIYHIQKSEAAGLNVFHLLDRYFIPNLGAYHIWKLVNWDKVRIHDVQPLHIAAYLGFTSYTQHLIDSGKSVHSRDGEGRTPLFYAVEEGRADIVSLLLSHGADPESIDRVGHKPLHIATEGNKIEVVKILLAAGVSPKTKKMRNSPYLFLENFGSDYGTTPLQYACTGGHLEILKLFIDCVDEEEACRCLHWTMNSPRKDTSLMMEVILKSGKAQVDAFVAEFTALSRAVKQVEPTLIKLLLQYGADPNIMVEKEDLWDRFSPAASVKYNLVFPNGRTLIQDFARLRRTEYGSGKREEAEECLKLLVDAGGDINAKGPRNQTPLHYAVGCGGFFREYTDNGFTTLTMTELLLQYGANPNVRCDLGNTPLHKVSSLQPDVVKILIAHGAEVNAKNNDGSSPLLSYMSSTRTYHSDDSWGFKSEVGVQGVFTFIQNGADVTLEDTDGWTVFHSLFHSIDEFNDENLWKAVINAGGDLNKLNKHGKPPVLCMTQIKGRLYEKRQSQIESLVRMLVEAGLEINATDPANRTLLFRVCDASNVSLSSVQRLLGFGCSVKNRDKDGKTILHKCLQAGTSFDVVLYLVGQGVDPTAVDNDGNNVLHELASKRPDNTTLILLERLIRLGVPTDTQNTAGRIPLHLACAHVDADSNIDVTKKFLDYLLDGKLCPVSNIDALDMVGASPIHYAASFSQYNVGHLLRAGADPALTTHEGRSPLHIAAIGRASNVMQVLLWHYGKSRTLKQMIDLPDSKGCTALHYACRSGRPESVRSLISVGANVFAKDKVGRTPLHALAEFPDEEKLWAPIQRGEVVDLLDAAWFTIEGAGRPRPNFWATSSPARTREILEMLELAGVNLRTTWTMDGEEQTVMDVAVRTQCAELVYELRNRGMIARDSVAEGLIPQPGGKAEAKALFERAKPCVRKGTVEEEQRSRMEIPAKFKEILNQRDYNLFQEFISVGGDLVERGDKWTRSLDTGMHTLVGWGYATLLERYPEEAKRLDNQEWMKEQQYPGTLLFWAAVQTLPRLDVIKVLVEKFKVDVNKTIEGECKRTALHSLAEGTHFWNIEAVNYLLDHGADIEAINSEGNTPLMAAVSIDRSRGFWREETIRVLLERGANPNFLKDGKSCLAMSNHVNVTSLLLKSGADVFGGSILPIVPLASALEMMDVKIAKVLLEAGADPNKDSPLYQAARPRQPDGVADSNWIEAQQGMIELLLKFGSDPFAVDEKGSSALQKVIEEHGILDQFWALPDLPVDLRGEGGRTLLISTCYPIIEKSPPIYDYSKPELLSVCIPDSALLLAAKGADVTLMDDLGRNALHWICTLSLPKELDETHQKLVRTLIKRAPSLIHQRDNQGFKPYHLAAVNAHRNVWMTDYLISQGADPKEEDPAGNNILHYLAIHLVGQKKEALTSAERFKHLLSLGTPLEQRNKQGETPFFRFIATSWVRNWNFDPVTHISTGSDDISHLKALSILLDANVDLHTRNARGENVLHASAKRWGVPEHEDQENDIVEIFKELLARGVDPRVEDGEFKTPIDVAVANSSDQIVALFGVKNKEVILKREVLDTEAEDEDEDDDHDDGMT